MGIIVSSAGTQQYLNGHAPPPDHQRKLQNLMVSGTSKNELAVEGTNNGTTRTADTTTHTHKTFESANNSNSVKGSAVPLNQQPGKINTIFPQKPPRDHSINRNRPSTTASSSTAFRFYHYQQQNHG